MKYECSGSFRIGHTQPGGDTYVAGGLGSLRWYMAKVRPSGTETVRMVSVAHGGHIEQDDPSWMWMGAGAWVVSGVHNVRMVDRFRCHCTLSPCQCCAQVRRIVFVLTRDVEDDGRDAHSFWASRVPGARSSGRLAYMVCVVPVGTRCPGSGCTIRVVDAEARGLFSVSPLDACWRRRAYYHGTF
jgi:hypothetical protein